MEKFNKIKYSTLNQPYFCDTLNPVSEKTFENICFRQFKSRAHTFSFSLILDKKKKANLERINDEKLIDRFKEDGYLPLNTFCDLKKSDIVMDYNTIYKRIFSNEKIAQYLNDNDYIYIYYKRNKKGNISPRKSIIVNESKSEEFLKLIHNHFLSDEQQKMKLQTLV